MFAQAEEQWVSSYCPVCRRGWRRTDDSSKERLI